MRKLIILNFTTCSVDIYDVDSDADIDEEYISRLGYSINSIEWMIGEGMSIHYHKGVLA